LDAFSKVTRTLGFSGETAGLRGDSAGLARGGHRLSNGVRRVVWVVVVLVEEFELGLVAAHCGKWGNGWGVSN
jgi:hypothetical protein